MINLNEAQVDNYKIYFWKYPQNIFRTISSQFQVQSNCNYLGRYS